MCELKVRQGKNYQRDVKANIIRNIFEPERKNSRYSSRILLKSKETTQNENIKGTLS